MSEEKHSYTISQQPDGLFCANIVGGYLETIRDCPDERRAVNAALYAIAKNKEYEEEAAGA